MKNFLIFSFTVFLSLCASIPCMAESANSSNTTSAMVAAPSELINAYKREFSFLETQKRAMQARKFALEQKLRNSKEMHQKKLSLLERKLLSLDTDIDRANEKISQVQTQLEEKNENTQLVEVTVNQARETLKSYGVKVLDFQDGARLSDEDILNIIFERAGALLGGLSDIKKEDGVFFLEDGSQTKGKIIRVGRIASYGISEKATGCLIPAGEGYLKIWNPDDPEKVQATADALLNSSPLPSETGIFIYDNPDKAVEPPKTKDFRDIIRAGGVVGYVIIAFGLIALIVAAIRFFRLQLAANRTKGISANVTGFIKKGEVREAGEFCAGQKGVMARVLSSVIGVIDKDRETLEYIISESLLREGGKLSLGRNVINAVSMVSPLLGLLGTVAGIIKTFDVIVQFGTGNPKMMAGGISEALVTTELGLIVAIPAYIIGTLLSGQEERIKAEIEEATLKVINLYHSLKQG